MSNVLTRQYHKLIYILCIAPSKNQTIRQLQGVWDMNISTDIMSWIAQCTYVQQLQTNTARPVNCVRHMKRSINTVLDINSQSFKEIASRLHFYIQHTEHIPIFLVLLLSNKIEIYVYLILKCGFKNNFTIWCIQFMYEVTQTWLFHFLILWLYSSLTRRNWHGRQICLHGGGNMLPVICWR